VEKSARIKGTRNSSFPFVYSKKLQRFENWNRARAPFWPYFFRSLTLASRRTNPAFFNAFLKSGLASISALVIPCRIAPACPETPPPTTLLFTLNDSRVLVKTSGCFTIPFKDSILKYSSMGLLLTIISPLPGVNHVLANGSFSFSG